jgi:chromosome segregation ATPase
MENGQEPATKQDLAAVQQDVADLKQDVAGVKQDVAGVQQDIAGLKQDVAMIRSEMQHTHDDLVERIADMQTGMLKAFYSFAESNQTRLTDSERESASLKERMGILERRLTEVERKVNFPNNPIQ